MNQGDPTEVSWVAMSSRTAANKSGLAVVSVTSKKWRKTHKQQEFLMVGAEVILGGSEQLNLILELKLVDEDAVET